MATNNLYFHHGQLRSILADANTEYIVCGRGWGKSEGPGGKRTSDWANNMPRGSIGIVGSTYMQLLDRTLPPLYRAWERLGYRRNVHYWVRQKPPKSLQIPLPYYAPDTDKNTIYWWNGACFKLISQDRPGSANGTTLDALYNDEAKLINKKKFDLEISKANRGNVREFGHYAGHHGILFMTDMPTTPEAKWILDKQYDMQLELLKGGQSIKMARLISIIQNYQLQINNLYARRYQATDRNRVKAFNRLIAYHERKINELRKETVNYTSGSSLENIHFLGIDTIKKWKRDDLDIEFRTQVLNEQLYQVPNSFYTQFDTAMHCNVDRYNYKYVESMGLYLPDGVIQDSRMDGDCNPNEPIDVGMDVGGSINCLVTGQEKEEHYQFLKSLFVKKPMLSLDVVDNTCEHYQHHKCKIINFYYDHTFIGTDATRLLTHADSIIQRFRKHGWTVRPHYIGKTPGHDARYRMWNLVMQGVCNDGVKPVQYCRDNCKQLIVSIQCTGAREVKVKDRTETHKDKRPEHRSDVPQEEAPHFTDAMDTLFIGRYRDRLGYAIPRTSMIISDSNE